MRSAPGASAVTAAMAAFSSCCVWVVPLPLLAMLALHFLRAVDDVSGHLAHGLAEHVRQHPRRAVTRHGPDIARRPVLAVVAVEDEKHAGVVGGDPAFVLHLRWPFLRTGRGTFLCCSMHCRHMIPGVSKPLRLSSGRSASMVSGGKPRRRQLLTLCSVKPNISATARVPPNASIAVLAYFWCKSVSMPTGILH